MTTLVAPGTMPKRRKVDARNAYCPAPLMELIAALRHAEIGDELEVWSSDKASVADIPDWVKKVGHEQGEITECDGYWSIVVKKAK